MRVLVTGVAGFIGSHLAKALIAQNDEVIGIDNLSAGIIEQIDPRVRFFQADIRSPEIHPLFRRCDAVFHLAAKNCLPDCLERPVEAAEVNVVGTANVLEAARRAGVPRFIYTDTSAEYEGVDQFPSRVDRTAPQSVYALSKHAGALFCQASVRFYNLRVTVLRYFNVYGPAQDWRRSTPPLMSGFISRLLRGEAPVIYGTGEKRRDFIYIDDVVAFNLLTLRDPRTEGQVYNVGTGTNYSVNEVYAAVEGLMRTGLSPVYRPDLPGEAQVTLADTTRERELGWQPRIDLRTGLERSIAYISDQRVSAGCRPRRW